jgi:predicted MFS family arabinose efflux permease
MAYFAGDFRAAFWIAVIPAMLAVMLIVFGVDEPDRTDASQADGPRLRIADIRRLPRTYVIVVTIAAVLTLARFSEAFLVLRAQNIGFSNATAPLVMVVMSVVYAATSYPAGAMADRGHGARLLSCGLAALVAADLVLAHAGGRVMVLAGAALWGLHMGLTQGLLSALVAGSAPADMRGTAFGAFNLVCGVALLVASGLAGWLWDAFGPRFTFYAGATFTVIAWIGFMRYGRRAAALPRA